MYNFLSIKVYMDPSSKKPIQEVSELLKQLKKDITQTIGTFIHSIVEMVRTGPLTMIRQWNC